MSVNVLTREISKVCRDHLLVEKWVLAPSLRAGHEWLVAVTRSGQPVINGHVKTLFKLALDLAGPLMVEKELELVSAQARLASHRSGHGVVEETGGGVSLASVA